MDIIRIKSILKNKKMTYEELSEKSGVPIGTLKSIFSGRTPHPRTDTMAAILETLGVVSDSSTVSASKQNLINAISDLSDADVEKALEYLEFLKSQRK